jgi:RNA polymerase sigma-70 factor (ECF subfamily)
MNSQTMLSEQTLIAKAREGNSSAFGELVRRNSGRVYAMSLKMLKNHEDAEDNSQNAFCKAYRKIRQFEGNSQFSTWLVSIAINEALMMLRKRRPERSTESTETESNAYNQASQTDLHDLHADPESQYVMKDLAEKTFEVLTPALKSTFILQKGEGWTSYEVAKALNITAETVKSRIFRARVRLRERLLSLSKAHTVALQS